MKLTHYLFVICLFCSYRSTPGWGFWAHKHINRCAIFTLPPSMFTFYKYHLGYLTERAVNPDKRRYAIEGEAPKHYIDLEYYNAITLELPQKWEEAIQQYGKDSLAIHGTLPWHIYYMKQALTLAFHNRSAEQIIRLSADIGHYIADAHVPLHTSENYNGQFTNQEGIHELWETRIPELFGDSYSAYVGNASYIADPKERIWKITHQTHEGVNSLLRLEKILSDSFPAIRKFSFEIRGGQLRKIHSTDYVQAYHELLDGQVKRQMQASMKAVGDFWFTCWIDGG
jgi:hypothetical protein